MNIASRLRENAQRKPEQTALTYPAGSGYASKSYGEIERESDALARGFARVGIQRGTRTIVMLRPGFELFACLFALIKLGAVPVIVDPGMGVGRMLRCYRAVGAEAFIGIPVAHVVRVFSPRAFAGLSSVITAGRRWFWGGHSLAELAEHAAEPFELAPVADQDLLFINFTTGSTGPAKGVEYTHGMALAMLERIVSGFGQSEHSITFATLPLFVIFDLLLGSRSILPAMDVTKPAFVDAARMVSDIQEFGATHMFASPAFLHRVGAHASRHNLTLPSLRTVVAGGAPVGDAILRCMERVLTPGARLAVTYGATEALPIASIDAERRLAMAERGPAAGRGTCVGQPTERLAVRIVRISDEPLQSWSDGLELPTGEVGEIVLAGDIVSPSYHRSPAYDALHKIAEGSTLWHRTGDLGYLDGAGDLWFCGRKSQRVNTAQGPAYTVQWEGVFNAHPEVHRTALVGVAGQAVLCVELHPGVEPGPRIARELDERGRACGLTVSSFLFHPRFPVDIRHNAKIGREQLARWAQRKLTPPRARALYIVPIAGWLFLLAGLVVPFTQPVLRGLWLLDLFLSVGVHGAQLFAAVPRGKRAGYSTGESVFRTFLLGATWWKFLGSEASTASEPERRAEA
jgi:acyl-CoA synthetase (AMP-forming)/AMP-acid ligase II